MAEEDGMTDEQITEREKLEGDIGTPFSKSGDRPRKMADSHPAQDRQPDSHEEYDEGLGKASENNLPDAQQKVPWRATNFTPGIDEYEED